MKTLIRYSVCLFAFMLAWPALADTPNQQSFANGQYRVLFNIFNSTLLTPSVASEYQIERAKDKGLINIVVQKKQADGSYQGVKAEVSADQFDLVQHLALSVRPIDEGKVVYYLASFTIQHNIDNYFTLSVKVDGHDAFVIKQTKRLYKDE